MRCSRFSVVVALAVVAMLIAVAAAPARAALIAYHDLGGTTADSAGAYVTDQSAPNGVATLLTETFDPAMTYTLTAQVARYVDDSYWAGYLVQLVAGGTRVNGARYSSSVSGGTVIAEDRNTQAVPLAAGDTDEWVTSTVVYTPDPADAVLAGEPLQIRLLTLRKPGDPGGDHGYPDPDLYSPWITYAAYDDVTLDGTVGAAAIPEPSTFALAALGLLGLGLFGRRRRRR